MKKLVIVAVMLVGFLTFAQEKVEQKGDRKARMENRESLSPEQQAELQVKRMTLDLDLNSKQQGEIKKIVLEQAKKREAKKTQWKANKEAGKTASKDEKFAMKNEALDEQIAMKAEMKKILLTLFVCFTLASVSLAQDPNFSQFFASALSHADRHISNFSILRSQEDTLLKRANLFLSKGPNLVVLHL